MDLNVLIVDDSPAMRAFVRRTLEASGLRLGACFEAANGAEALQLLEDQRVDAVLTDINMPQMDGEEFLRRLAAHDLLHRVPVWVISTDRTEGRMHRMLTLGARGYVTKPFSPEILREAIEHSLGASHATE